MSKYRQVQVSFWQDAFVLDLTPEEKYFYIYLMTNSKSTQIGIYELPKRIIETETGYNRETVEKLLQRFVDYGKIEYHEPTKEIFINNWAKHNWNNSPKIVTRVEKELCEIKYLPFVEKYLEIVGAIKSDEVSIQYRYPIDTKEKDKEKDKEKENDKDKDPLSDSPNTDDASIPYSEIISYLNQKCITRFRETSAKTRSLIKARYKDGFNLADFFQVIDIKAEEWLKDSAMNQFLRPETLFGTKFESYLNQKPKGASSNGKGYGNNHAGHSGKSAADVLADAKRANAYFGG